MGRRCLVCAHPDRLTIEGLLLTPRSAASIADEYEGLSAQSLARHRANHMDAERIAQAQALLSSQGGLNSCYSRLARAPNGLQMQRFVDELLADPKMNGTRAAVRAGWAKSSASSTASTLLKRDDVRAAIVERQTDRKVRLELKADLVLEEMTRIAFADLRDFVTWESDGTVRLKSSSALGPEARAIKSLSLSPSGKLDVQLHDKTAIFRMLREHLGESAPAQGSVFRVVLLDPKTGAETPVSFPVPTREPDD